MSWRLTALVALAFLALGLGIYSPALRGEWISDDLFLLTSPAIQELSLANLRVILDPGGPLARTFHNYSPVHALLHAVEIQLFGEALLPYHLVNVVVHSGVALLFAALLIQLGLPRLAALLGAVLFLVHPANVEAVAWTTQLKTTACAALALGALLLHPRRPALAALLFALALLTKAHAAFALFVLALLEWARAAGQLPAVPGAADAPRWRWVALWGVLLALFAAVELPIFEEMGAASRPLLESDGFFRLRTMVAIAARYAAMAVAGHGLSAFQDVPLPRSSGDPWWLAGIGLLTVLGARFAWTLARRRPEAAFWGWALAALAPVSQFFPFRHMVADRYLYLILPGLIGALLFAARDLWTLLGPGRQGRALARGAALGAAGLAVAFGLHSFERARIWRNTDTVHADAARHHPDGVHAHLLRARQAGWTGDVEGAVTSLRAARARGWSWIGPLFEEPAFQRIRNHPRFRALVREITGDMIRDLEAVPRPGAGELQVLAQLHLWRGDPLQAEAALERIVEQGGPAAEESRAALAAMRKARGAGPSPQPSETPE